MYITYSPANQVAHDLAKRDPRRVNAFRVKTFTSLEEWHAVATHSLKMPPYEEFVALVKEKVKLGREGKDNELSMVFSPRANSEDEIGAWNVHIEAVREFDQVPAGRSVEEIEVLLNYVASTHNYCAGSLILKTEAVYKIMSSPHEVINPTTFNWNIAELKEVLEQTVRLGCFLDQPQYDAIVKSVTKVD